MEEEEVKGIGTEEGRERGGGGESGKKKITEEKMKKRNG
jgi:hypothetical protein